MKTSLLALGLLAALPFAASAADNLSYTYAEGDYIKTDADGGKADGWAFKGSYAFHPNWSVFGDYDNQKLDNSDFEVQKFRVGVGYNYSISDSTDLVARVAYNKFDPDRSDNGLKFERDGYSAEAGLRNAFGEHFEVYALAGYENYGKKYGTNPDGEFYGRLGGQVKINQNWGFNGDIKMNKDGDKEWSIGPRYSW